ncbi:hypothetical protein KKC94_00085 [Patescibacteria group bacterium]|nr:hypothetical protein [Patescibacteria group bacterium]
MENQFDSGEYDLFEDAKEKLAPSRLLRRIKTTGAWNELGAVGIGSVVFGLNVIRGATIEGAVKAGCVQFAHTSVVGVFLVPTYEVVAGFCDRKEGFMRTVVPVLVPWTMNIGLNASLHHYYGTAAFYGSVAAAGIASLGALSAVHYVRLNEDEVKAKVCEIRAAIQGRIEKLMK